MKATADLWEEHKAVLRMLTVLEGLVARIGKGETPSADDLQKVVEFLRVFVDRCHHGKEEQLLFPALRKVADADTQRLIDRLLDEHEEGRAHAATLAAVAGFAPAAGAAVRTAPACRPGEEAEYAMNGYIALLRPHIAAEQMTLFPTADKILPAEVQQELERGYTLVEEQVVGPGRHEAFEALLHELKERYVD
jgi:hemerythrin-like domain-containing protein